MIEGARERFELGNTVVEPGFEPPQIGQEIGYGIRLFTNRSGATDRDGFAEREFIGRNGRVGNVEGLRDQRRDINALCLHEFDSFRECNAGVDCTGNKLPYAPEFKIFLSAQYEFDVSDRGDNMYFRMDYSNTDDYFTHPENTPVVREVDSFDVLNARIGYTSADGTWDVSAWMIEIPSD